MKLKFLIRTINLIEVVDGIDYFEIDAGDLKYPREAFKDNENEFRALVSEWEESGNWRAGDIEDYKNIIEGVSERNNEYFEELDKLKYESIREDVEMDCLANYNLK